jgi:hypothetical protein
MRELYIEGVAIHGDPESCAGVCSAPMLGQPHRDRPGLRQALAACRAGDGVWGTSERKVTLRIRGRQIDAGSGAAIALDGAGSRSSVIWAMAAGPGLT